jgi:hypothetical protein
VEKNQGSGNQPRGANGTDLTFTFEEGMARAIGTQMFIRTKDCRECWHCQGERVCRCAGCAKDKPEGTCEACLGSGLLTFYKGLERD